MSDTVESAWNDEQIPDEEILYRHLHPSQWVLDEESGAYRPSSAFMRFEAGVDGLSVYGATKLMENGFEPEVILRREECGDTYGLVFLTAQQARDEECGVVYDPQNVYPYSCAHMLIKEPRRKLSRRDRKDLGTALCGKLKVIRQPGG